MDKTDNVNECVNPGDVDDGFPEQQTLTLQRALDLAVQHHSAGDLHKAEGIYQKILQADPDQPETLNLLGVIAYQVGKNGIAVDLLTKAISLKPDYADAHSNLGLALYGLRRLDDTLIHYSKAIQIKPDYAEAHYNLGISLRELGRLDEAIAHYCKAIQIKPDYFEAHNNLGNAHKRLGRLCEAIASYGEALAIKPEFPEAGKNLLLAMLYVPGLSPGELFTEHLRFSENHAIEISPLEEELSNEPTPDRRLKVGYLSSNFQSHPVGYNILPLLSSHDRTKFEIYCYADVRRPDAITERFQSCVDHWNTITGKSDAEVASMVRADEIDVLVCLAGHFDNNRPLVCAHRAAPVQVSYHDVATSGLEEMDYFLTDNFLNPLDTKEMFTEELYRLSVFYQYPPVEEAPPVAAVPGEQTGVITFGSFNNPTKVNEEVIRLWAEILGSVPDSRLLLKYMNWYEQASLRDRVLERFSACGIEQDRIIFGAVQDAIKEHLERYHEVDIALDPFPFSGATTAFQALWMGVPVVSLAGETFNSRIGGSILHHVGLGELVADTPEAYVACARDLAGDVARLKTFRTTLRDRIASSQLCDAPTYARTAEAAYRDMWRTWCAPPKKTP